MKKLSIFLSNPVKLMISTGLVILVSEFLIMLLIEFIHSIIQKDTFLTMMAFEFVDPILLIAFVSPAFYILIFRPMCSQQAELEQQLDELRRFQKLTVGRELHMQELVKENTALRLQIAAAQPGEMES